MKYETYQFRAMASPCEIKAWVPENSVDKLLERIAQEAVRLEKKYSRYIDDSVTSIINRAAGKHPVEIDEETLGLLDFAEASWRQSNGLFDLTSGILRRAWDFKSGLLPSQYQIDELLPLVGWDKVIRSRTSIFLPNVGMEIDFGGIVKEFAVDRLVAMAKVNGLKHGLVNMGGDIHIFGPEPDGSPQVVGVRHPREDRIKAGIPIHAGAMATSGDYERYIEVDGQRFCHILNPKTGWPCAEWQSVSVIAPQCVMAGIASSVAMLMPKEQAIEWLKSQNFMFLLIDADDVISHGLSPARAVGDALVTSEL